MTLKKGITSGKFSLNIDNLPLEVKIAPGTTSRLEFKDDPELTDINPKWSIKQGGSRLKISGDSDLDIINEAEIRLTGYPDNPKGKCERQNEELICQSPRKPDEKEVNLRSGKSKSYPVEILFLGKRLNFKHQSSVALEYRDPPDVEVQEKQDFAGIMKIAGSGFCFGDIVEGSEKCGRSMVRIFNDIIYI